jgi:hypothetical protein
VTLSTEQERFLVLHARHNVVKWVWHFSESLLRAYTDRGHTATISKAGFASLGVLGLVDVIGAGGGGPGAIRITDAGKGALE